MEGDGGWVFGGTLLGERRPGSVSPGPMWVSLPIRENSCHSWFHLKACVFREGWRIFNHE